MARSSLAAESTMSTMMSSCADFQPPNDSRVATVWSKESMVLWLWKHQRILLAFHGRSLAIRETRSGGRAPIVQSPADIVVLNHPHCYYKPHASLMLSDLGVVCTFHWGSLLIQTSVASIPPCGMRHQEDCIQRFGV